MRFLPAVVTLLVASGGGIHPAAADKIKHSIAVFSGLDKITGRIISFEVATNETVQFGTLQITERVCYTRPPTEAPQTDTFVEVDDLGADKKAKRIFTGWMFAASPGLHALDHPVYDIWLTGCKGDEQVIASPPSTAAVEPVPAAKPPPPAPPALRGTAETEGTARRPSGPIEVGPPPGFVPPGAPSAAPGQQLPPSNSAPGDF
ncbi:MAG: DUF2155 domain-containing protein [Methylovirgula sp.]